GNIFGTTFIAGEPSYPGVVFEIPAGSSTVLNLGSTVGNINGLTQDSSGNLIGVTSGAGTPGDGTVFEVTDPNPYVSRQSLLDQVNTASAITLSSTDPNGDPLTYTVSNPANGTLSGTAPNLIYTPNPGFTGSDSFQFTITDTVTGLVSNTGTISIKVLNP